MISYKFWCICIRDDNTPRGSHFEVSVDRTTSINNLKKKVIKEAQLRDVTKADLELWKVVPEILHRNPRAEFRRKIAELEIPGYGSEEESTEHVHLLDASQMCLNYWNTPPEEDP